MKDIIWEVLTLPVDRILSDWETGGAQPAAVLFLCMSAFGLILLGAFIASRCAVLFYIDEGRERLLLGSVYIRCCGDRFLVRIPEYLIEKSETTQYQLKISPIFSDQHYMDELLIQTETRVFTVLIKKSMLFCLNQKTQLQISSGASRAD